MSKQKSLILVSSLVLCSTLGCANRPPVISCAIERPSIIQGESVSVQAEISDRDRFFWGGDDEKLTLTWKADSGTVSGETGPVPRKGPKSLSGTFDSTGLSPGRYQVIAEVSDRKLTESCTMDITVEKHKEAPTIACEPSSLIVTEGQSRRLQVRASDPNNDRLNYTWTVDGRAVSNNQPSFEFGTVNRPVGDHRVSVRVTDVDEMSADCDFNVTIDTRPNTSPSATLTLDKTDVFAGDTIAATTQASDPENDPLTYTWSVDGQRRPDTSSRIQINTRGLAGGRHSVAVTVEDDRGAAASDTKSFSVSEKIVLRIEATRPDNMAKAQLDEIALKMRQNPQLRATLTGHTDDQGSEEVNERMGLRRADGVKAYLVDEQNIGTSRIESQSAGETQPIADNQTPQGRSDNRRVEVELFVP